MCLDDHFREKHDQASASWKVVCPFLELAVVFVNVPQVHTTIQLVVQFILENLEN